MKYTFKELLEIAVKDAPFPKEKYEFVVKHFFGKLKDFVHRDEPENLYIPRFGNLKINYQFVFKSLGVIYTQAKHNLFYNIDVADRLVNALKQHPNKKYYEVHSTAMARVKDAYLAWQQSRAGIGDGEISRIDGTE